MDSRECRRRIRRSRMSDDAEKCNRRRCAATMIVCVSASVAFVVCCLRVPSAYAHAGVAVAGDAVQVECQAPMRWPLEQTRIVGAYDAPAKQWLPGHRGVDLQARMRDVILAPADGTIAFSGKVAGKSVVTLRHGANVGNVTSTFEPAVTTLVVGTAVVKGERFARVEGASEHCSDQCLHWGLKGVGRDYSDPSNRVEAMRIGLKAV